MSKKGENGGPPRIFDGATVVPERDNERLLRQLTRVRELMKDQRWRSLAEISSLTYDPPASVSARLRDLRKTKFGGHTVNRRYIVRGLFEYQVVLQGSQLNLF